MSRLLSILVILLSTTATTTIMMAAFISRSSAFTTATRRTVAFSTACRQTNSRISSSSLFAGSSSISSSYSQATKERINGLDPVKEFSKLSNKMKTPPNELKVVLTERLLAGKTAGNNMSEKDEYLDWLLSGASSNKNRNMISKKSAPTTTRMSSNSNNVSSSRRSFSTEAPEKQTFATDIRFDDTKMNLDPLSVQAVTEMGLTHMTEIQSRTFLAAANGGDVLGRARTGTGKTVAFLLPAIERLIRENNINDPNTVGMLVVSPTRELASQIGEQASQLLKHHKGASVQVMFGGTNVKSDINRLSARNGLPTVIVATPGRLLDHMKTTKIKSGNNMVSFGKHIMSKTNLVVLDETDRLLDMGFRNDIERILDFLPSSKQRQTLLFSATIPADLKKIMRQHMKPDYVEVDCVKDGDAATHTNDSVTQTHFVLPKGTDVVSSVIDTVQYAVESHYSDDAAIPPKIVVFFPTARLVQFYAEIFQEITRGVSVIDNNNDYTDTNTAKKIKIKSWELHSKKTQGYRNRVSDEFRQAKTGVLFTSDVSARGVDYPNVSHVIQFGMPESRDQYIHRLGRTGRGGMKGKGWLVLQDWESMFIKELKGVNIPVNDELQTRILQETLSEESDMIVQEVKRRVRGGDGTLSKSAAAAYAAFLGYYKGQMKRMRMGNSSTLVQIANSFAMSSGFHEPPQLQKSTVSKMGLKGVPGLNIGPGDGGGGRGGGRGGGGGGRDSRDRRPSSSGNGNGGSSQDSVGRRFRQGQNR